jgi:hypothetical protein
MMHLNFVESTTKTKHERRFKISFEISIAREHDLLSLIIFEHVVK